MQDDEEADKPDKVKRIRRRRRKMCLPMILSLNVQRMVMMMSRMKRSMRLQSMLIKTRATKNEEEST